jgi:hypothetical protein
VIEVGPNFIARPYRGVSVQDADALDEASLRRWLVGRRVYRRTEFIVARHGGEPALVQVERDAGDGVLVPVRDVRLLASPGDLAFVRDPAGTPATPARWRGPRGPPGVPRACT